jgi:hypothetical protein
MKRRACLFLILLVGASGSFGQAVDKDKVVRSQQQVTAESELAKEPRFYFVLDLRDKALELRVRGMVLRSWRLREMKFWGKPAFPKTVQLVRKSTLKPPQRNVIKPGEAPSTPKNPAKFELEALELKDMPKSFSLEFDNGLHVSVKAAKRGIASFGDDFNWYVVLPVRSYFSARNGKAVSELELRFADEKDAQAIYWIFFDGIKGFVF